MKRRLAGIFVSIAVLSGCKPTEAPPTDATENPTPIYQPGPTPMDQDVVATIRGDVITRKDLMDPLVAGYGLNDLLLLIQLDLSRQELASAKLIVTPQDIDAERQITLLQLKKAARKMNDLTGASTQGSDDDEVSPDEAGQLLEQVLTQQHLSLPEFQIILETNANLRKLVIPQVEANVTEDEVRKLFNAEYGEKASTEYIVCNNMTEANEAKRDLAAGKSFEDVAKARSIDRFTAASGGELPPFTRQDVNRFPKEFVELVFSLSKGQVSDILQLGKYCYIVKLIDLTPPEHAKFKDYEDSVRHDLMDQLTEAQIVVKRRQLAGVALAKGVMNIKDPILAAQYQERLQKKDGELKDMNAIRHRMDEQHSNPATTEPSTLPSDIIPMTPMLGSKAAGSGSASEPATAPAAK